jgi:hypothetical protein
MIENKYKKPEVLDVVLTVRITKKMQKFIKDNNYSISLIVRDSLRRLGFKD